MGLKYNSKLIVDSILYGTFTSLQTLPFIPVTSLHNKKPWCYVSHIFVRFLYSHYIGY